MLSLPAMPRLSFVLALLGAGCAAQPAQDQIASPVWVAPVVTPVAARPPAPATAPAPAPAADEPDESASPSEPMPCLRGTRLLYRHSIVWPPKPTFDAAAHAFDSAITAYKQRRYLRAAHGFMAAAAGFLAADNAANRRWSYGNAAFAWQMTGRLDVAQAAFLDAAARDPELGPDLERLAANLRPICPPAP